MFIIKQVTKEEMNKLIENGYIHNTSRGFKDSRGREVGFRNTRNKKFIDDKFADIAKRLWGAKWILMIMLLHIIFA